MYFADQNFQSFGILLVYFNIDSLIIVDNFVSIGSLFTKIDVSRSNSVIFSLYFTRNKGYVRGLKFHRQNVFHSHFHIHVCSDSCYFDTHRYTRNHCRKKDISGRCKTSYTNMTPIQEPTKNWISVTCVVYKDLFSIFCSL